MTGKYNKPGSREKRINMSRRRKNSAARQKRRLLIYGAAGIAAAAVIAITVPQLQKRQTAVYGETQAGPEQTQRVQIESRSRK